MKLLIENETLSDGSEVYNVRITDDRRRLPQGKRAGIEPRIPYTIVIGCEDRKQADAVYDLLDQVTFIEVL